MGFGLAFVRILQFLGVPSFKPVSPPPDLGRGSGFLFREAKHLRLGSAAWQRNRPEHARVAVQRLADILLHRVQLHAALHTAARALLDAAHQQPLAVAADLCVRVFV